MKKIAIIGGGLSGLASAFFIRERAIQLNQPIEITIIEKDSRVGGKIWSIEKDGYLCEYGPNGFLDNKPDTLELCEKLGITDLLLKSNDNARKRFVVDKNQLYKLPHTPSEFIQNKLISWRGKLRIFAQILVKKSSLTDETVASFAKRRLGAEALTKLIAPMSSGIFAGNPETMSLSACFPRIKQLEYQYGGLFKAMFALRKQNKNKSSSSASAAGPGGILTSFSNGIEVLTKQLANAIGMKNIYLDCNVTSVSKSDTAHWQVLYTQRNKNYQLKFDTIVLATPAYATANLLHNHDSELSFLLKQINYSPLVVICLGYDLSKIPHDTNGFGYLFTHQANQCVLGTLWDSSIFVDRAPKDKILFRLMLGGARYPDINLLSDSDIITRATDSLKMIMGVTLAPEMIQVFRHENAIPQYNLGHLDLVDNIEKQAKVNSTNLYITGNAYRGIGINDCISSAKDLAKQSV